MLKINLERTIHIAYNNSFSYMTYKKIVNKYMKKDSRELNFQNRAIVCMLEKILINTDIEVVDTSILYYRGKRNPETLDNFQFTARGFAPPDLLLVRNWNIDNVNNKVEYLAAVEIKSPNSRKEWICGKNFDEYNTHIKEEVNAHLSVNAKVILTDCYRWQFFESQEEFDNPPAPIDLVDGNKHWKKHIINLDNVVSELLDLEDDHKKIAIEPEEWNFLQQKILKFLGIE